MTVIAGIWAGFLGLPRWVHAALAAGIAFALWLHFHDKAVIESHEAGVTKAVATRAAQAGEAAHSAVTATQAEKEQANERARQAAARNPDDPLRAGLGSLRRERTGAAEPAAR